MRGATTRVAVPPATLVLPPATRVLPPATLVQLRWTPAGAPRTRVVSPLRCEHAGSSTAQPVAKASSATGSPSSAFSARGSEVAMHVKLGVSRTV